MEQWTKQTLSSQTPRFILWWTVNPCLSFLLNVIKVIFIARCVRERIVDNSCRKHCPVYLSDFRKCLGRPLGVQSSPPGKWQWVVIGVLCLNSLAILSGLLSSNGMNNASLDKWHIAFGSNVNTKPPRAGVAAAQPLPGRRRRYSYHREMKIHCRKRHCGRGSFRTEGQTPSSDLEGNDSRA